MVWLVLFILLAVVSGLVLAAPFLFSAMQRRHPSVTGRATLNLAIHRRRLAELQDDLNTGSISPEAYAEAKAELEADAQRDIEALPEASSDSVSDFTSAAMTTKADSHIARRAWVIGVALVFGMCAVAFAIYAKLGAADVERALADAQAVQQQPDVTQAELTQANYAVLQTIEQQLDPTNKDDFGDYVRLARRYVAQQKIDDAIAAFEYALDLLPDEITDNEKANLHLELFALLLDNEYNFFDRKVQTLLAQAGQYTPETAYTIFQRFTQAYLGANQPSQAVRTLTQLQTLIEREVDPLGISVAQQSDFYLVFGRTVSSLNEQGFSEQTKTLFTKAAEVDPSNQMARLFAGLSAQNDGELEVAQGHYEWVIPRLDDAEMREQMLLRANEVRQALNKPAVSFAELNVAYQQALADEAAQAARRQAEQDARLAAALEASADDGFLPAGSAELTDPCPMEVAVQEGLRLTVTLDPALQDKVPENAVLFVYAKAPDAAQRQPIAVRRFEQFDLPMPVTLTDSDKLGMTPAKISDFSTWRVFAKITGSGIANMSPGDLYTEILLEDASEMGVLEINQIAE